MSEPQTPLTLDIVDETSIKSLIDQDPRKLKDKDLRRIINYMRVNRVEWLKAEAEARTTGDGARTKKPKIQLSAVDLDIEVDL